MEIKRVVTAVDADGKAVVQEDSPLAPKTSGLFPGTNVWMIWGTEGDIPEQGAHPVPENQPTFFPGPGGTRFGVITLPPGEERGAPPEPMPEPEVMEKLAAETEATLPGLLAAFEPDAPGMHTTPTVDYDVVLKGTLTLELDDGAEVDLPAGSCIIQNGTRHAWHNYGDEEAMLAYVIVDARR